MALSNAEKQRRYRERQKENGKKEMRGYLSKEALECYELIQEQTNWSDSVILSNAVRLTYAAYKNGQIGLLNNWLTKNKL
ncbi:hypothetical protein [Thalassotalea euphylliae]|uniref:Uncharacterized protein n=1 Tax=Thalassotalea euphylliae TaxID=1655234 RepID=A0A3E0UFM7_9GAMM|nr:hypothetical protein [Thalassotalea euphylliae]REL29621.1 hypothetical protein DXX94_02200 [Thalassotalea euphylliae]REL35660.1 hypothetical protein DXX92_10080 [Thalassotalea euphylliae]